MTHPDDRKGFLLAAALGVFIVLVFGGYFLRVSLRPHLGPDNCVYEDAKLLRKSMSDYTLVVVDQSEQLSDSHRRQVKALLLEQLTDEVKVADRSTVMLFNFGKNDFLPTGEGQSLAAAVSLCRPPATGSVVYEGKRKIERTFRDRFLLPLYSSVDNSLGVALGERSPILEMIQYLSRNQDIRDGLGGSNRKTLILVSDMLQHSARFSHYRPSTYEDFLKQAAPQLRADLRGWNIQVLYLQRYGKDERHQTPQHIEFWMRYFHEAGAKLETMIRVP